MHCSQKNTINKAQSRSLLNIDVICLKNEQTASSKQLQLQTNWICFHSENTKCSRSKFIWFNKKNIRNWIYNVKSIVILGWYGMTLELKHHKNVSTAFNRSITCKHLHSPIFSVSPPVWIQDTPIRHIGLISFCSIWKRVFASMSICGFRYLIFGFICPICALALGWER